MLPFVYLHGLWLEFTTPESGDGPGTLDLAVETSNPLAFWFGEKRMTQWEEWSGKCHALDSWD